MQLVDVLAQQREHDLGARLAAHLLDRLRQRHAARRGVVDLDDEVAGLDAGAEGRRVLDRRDDADEAVLDADLDAQAAEVALGGDLQLLERVGVEEVGVRVEPAHHPVDRFLDQLLVGDRLDVVALDLAEDGRQELQVLVGNRQLGFALRDRREIEGKQHPQHRAEADQPRLLPAVTHVVSRPLATPAEMPAFWMPRPLRRTGSPPAAKYERIARGPIAARLRHARAAGGPSSAGVPAAHRRSGLCRGGRSVGPTLPARVPLARRRRTRYGAVAGAYFAEAATVRCRTRRASARSSRRAAAGPSGRAASARCPAARRPVARAPPSRPT